MLRLSLFLQLILFSFLAATATAQASSAAAMAARDAEDRRRSEAEIASYRKALQENTRERAPLDWAATQNKLGEPLWLLGCGDSNSAWGRVRRQNSRRPSPLFTKPCGKGPAHACRLTGPGPRKISAMRSDRSARGGAGRRGWRRPLPPFAKPCRNGPARRVRRSGRRPRTASAIRLQSSASERVGRRGSRRPFPPIATPIAECQCPCPEARQPSADRSRAALMPRLKPSMAPWRNIARQTRHSTSTSTRRRARGERYSRRK
jgi:hypothetical protein